MKFLLTTEAEIEKALQYFNSFHDGFIKSIKLLSRNSIHPDFSQTISGKFDVEMEIAHYNYLWGRVIPFDQLVKFHLYTIEKFSVNFSQLYQVDVDWNIMEIKLQRSKENSNYSFILCYSAYDVEQKQWHVKEVVLFEFKNGEVSDE